MTKSYTEYKESRRRILNDDFKTKKRVGIHDSQKQATICNLCGEPLAVMSRSSGGVRVVRRFYHLNYPGFFYVNLCEDAKMCYNSYVARNKKGDS